MKIKVQELKRRALPCLGRYKLTVDCPVLGDCVLWLEDKRALGYSVSVTSSGVRTYSLRKPWWINFFRYHWRLQQ